MHPLPRPTVETDPVWIDLVELVNKVSEIPFNNLFVVLGMHESVFALGKASAGGPPESSATLAWGEKAPPPIGS